MRSIGQEPTWRRRAKIGTDGVPLGASDRSAVEHRIAVHCGLDAIIETNRAARRGGAGRLRGPTSTGVPARCS